jgi:hypothetical protein
LLSAEPRPDQENTVRAWSESGEHRRSPSSALVLRRLSTTQGTRRGHNLGHMTTTVIDRIGLLATNDPELGEGAGGGD